MATEDSNRERLAEVPMVLFRSGSLILNKPPAVYPPVTLEGRPLTNDN